MGLVISRLKGSWFGHDQGQIPGHDALPHVQRCVKFLDEGRSKIKAVGALIKIGRNNLNHIILDDHRVSRFHCEIRRRGYLWKRWYIRDTGSSSGIQIRRGKLNIVRGKHALAHTHQPIVQKDTAALLGAEDARAEVRLRNGDELVLGETILLMTLTPF